MRGTHLGCFCFGFGSGSRDGPRWLTKVSRCEALHMPATPASHCIVARIRTSSAVNTPASSRANSTEYSEDIELTLLPPLAAHVSLSSVHVDSATEWAREVHTAWRSHSNRSPVPRAQLHQTRSQTPTTTLHNHKPNPNRVQIQDLPLPPTPSLTSLHPTTTALSRWR